MGGKSTKVRGKAQQALLAELTDIKLSKKARDVFRKVRIAGAGVGKMKRDVYMRAEDLARLSRGSSPFPSATRSRSGLLGVSRGRVRVKGVGTGKVPVPKVARMPLKSLPGGTRRTYRATAVASASRSKDLFTLKLPLRRPVSIRMRFWRVGIGDKVPGSARLITKIVRGRTVRVYVSNAKFTEAVDALVKAGRSRASAERYVMKAIKEAM